LGEACGGRRRGAPECGAIREEGTGFFLPIVLTRGGVETIIGGCQGRLRRVSPA